MHWFASRGGLLGAVAVLSAAVVVVSAAVAMLSRGPVAVLRLRTATAASRAP